MRRRDFVRLVYVRPNSHVSDDLVGSCMVLSE